MEYIKNQISIDLKSTAFQSFSSKDNGTLLYPYKNIEITTEETYYCPFCGNKINYLSCNCKEFKKALKQLQDSLEDSKHKTSFHHPEFNHSPGIIKPISEFEVKELTKEEILSFGLDLWDSNIRYPDNFSDKEYMVSSIYEDSDNKFFFLCKDLKTKIVYKLRTEKPEHTNKKIILGVYAKRTISGDKERLGSYRIESYLKKFKEFNDWKEVCETLKKL